MTETDAVSADWVVSGDVFLDARILKTQDLFLWCESYFFGLLRSWIFDQGTMRDFGHANRLVGITACPSRSMHNESDSHASPCLVFLCGVCILARLLCYELKAIISFEQLRPNMSMAQFSSISCAKQQSHLCCHHFNRRIKQRITDETGPKCSKCHWHVVNRDESWSGQLCCSQRERERERERDWSDYLKADPKAIMWPVKKCLQ